MSKSKPVIGINDLQSQHPEIASEWHPKLNGDLRPTDVTKGSHRKVWWQCRDFADHAWQSSVCNRTKKNGSGCRICNDSTLVSIEQSIQTKYPELCKEWHIKLNGDLKPSEVRASSHKRVFWQCSVDEHHVWQAAVFSRCKDKRGCPFCSGRRTLPGENDLNTTHPEIAKQWHPKLNGSLLPSEVKAGSSKRVHWQCEKDPTHSWQAIINSRTSGNWGCPICSGLKTLKDFNDIQKTHPEVAKQWHPTLNKELRPTEVTAGSNKKVYWQCPKYDDHYWITTVAQRTSQESGCPICSGYQALEGFNDLKTTHPEIASQWHPVLNGKLRSMDVTAGSQKKAFWQCNQFSDHIWNTTIKNQVKSGPSCRVCSGKEVLIGFNDLKTTHPEIASEWDLHLNKPLSPADVSAGSAKSIHWQCKNNPNHNWIAMIKSRTILGHGCPDCAETGFNPSKEAWFYLMSRPGEQQLGITNAPDRRMQTHQRNGWDLIEMVGPAPGSQVAKTEKRFKAWLKKKVGLMPGTTENWSTTSLEVQSLRELKLKSGIETNIF